MIFNLPCKDTSCDNNTGFQVCMFGIDEDLIKYVKCDKPMCDKLKKQIIGLIKVFKDE